MVRLLLLAVAILGSSGLAAQLTSPAEHHDVQPGAFVSIPVVGEGDVPLTVQAPEQFQVVGTPQLRDGRGLVNLLVGREARAGEHIVTIGTSGTTLKVTVRVAPRYAVTLHVPEGKTIVGAQGVDYPLLVSNGGNAPETVALRVDSRLAPRLSAERLELAPGETREVTLSLQAAGRSTGRDAATVIATVLEAEDVQRFATVYTTVLPFAGADEIEGPVLGYRLEAGASYGSAGLGYLFRARLDGELSDHVRTDADLTFRAQPGGAPSVSGHAALAGEQWRVGYRGTRDSHRFEARYDAVRGYVAFTPGGYGFGVTYSPSPLTLDFTHRGGSTDHQTFSASYRLRVAPELTLSPRVGLERRADGDGVDVFGVLGLTAELQTEPLLGTARVRLPVPFDDDWFVGAAISSRSQTPFGVQAEAILNARGLHAHVALNEEVSEEVTLQQRLGYSGENGNVNLGVRYRHAELPLTLGANVGAGFGSRGFTGNYGANVSYRPAPFSVSAYFGGSLADGWSYGGSLGFREGAWGASLAYAHSPRLDRLSASVVGAHAGLSGSAAYSFDLGALQHEASVGLEYTFAAGHSLFSTLAIDDGVRWQLGATFVLAGGFATPSGVVNAFGGRAVGFAAGAVFHDANRNGVLDPGEAPAAGVTVRAGSASTITDEDGRFSLPLPPGEHTLTVSGHSASYGLLEPLAFTVDLGRTSEVDVPLATVVTMIVKAFDDRNRDGVMEAGEPLLPLTAVVVQGPDGARSRRFVDSRGEAVFQNLPPGRYTVTFDPETLPRFYEPTGEPLSVTLAPGPIVRLDLGAAERPKEVVQTLRGGDLTLVARLEPMPAPPGADVLVTAQVGGEADQVEASLPGGESVRLVLIDGIYRGRLSVPESATGVLMVTVHAQRGGAERTQQLPLILAPGPLARLSTSPTLADPGEIVTVEADLLKRVTTAEVEVDGVRYPLEATDDPYRFVGTVPAPNDAGSHAVELFADGEKLTETRFRVQ